MDSQEEEDSFWWEILRNVPEHDFCDPEQVDYVSMGVFADWLEERGDARAAGMRVIAQRRKCPQYYMPQSNATGRDVWCWWKNEVLFSRCDSIPSNWWFQLQAPTECSSHNFKNYFSPREAFDALARAWAALDAGDRAGIENQWAIQEASKK